MEEDGDDDDDDCLLADDECVAKLCVSLSEKSRKGIAFFFAPFEYRFMARKRRPVTGDKLLGSASKRYNANCPLTHWCQLGSWTAAETPIEMKE